MKIPKTCWAGIDMGSTLQKIVWKEEGKGGAYSFASSADKPLAEILEGLKKKGIVQFYAVGTGTCSEICSGITETRDNADTLTENPIDKEIILQANGALEIMAMDMRRLGLLDVPEEFLLVSIGTGISYTFVTKNSTEHFPIGSALGGGFIHGMKNILGLTWKELATCQNKTLDLLIKDKILSLANTPLGERPIAHFGKATEYSSKEELSASLLSMVATVLAKDILLQGMIRAVPDHIVYIGTPISRLPSLQVIVSNWTQTLGKTPYFPKHGEYALAMGAYMEATQ